MNGCRAAFRSNDPSGVVTNFAYDYEDRITQITRSGMTTNTFSYNGFGARVSAVDSSGTRTFARNGTGVTAPVLGDGMANYTPGISERRGGVTRYQSSDIKNSTAQVSSSQTVVGAKQYDAFGNLTSSSGSWNGPFSYGGAFGYQSETDTGYQLLGHRYYDPTTGRFLTRDPIGDGRNWYTYCANNPVSYCDAEGLKKALVVVSVDFWDFGLVPAGARNRVIRLLRERGFNEFEFMTNPSYQQFEARITDDEIEGFGFVGHGPGEPDPDARRLDVRKGSEEELTPTGMKLIGRERKRKLETCVVWACNAQLLAEDFLQISRTYVFWSGSVNFRNLWDIPEELTNFRLRQKPDGFRYPKFAPLS